MDRRSLVQQMHEVCPIPEVATRVMQMTQDPNVSIGEVVRAVEADPAIAAELVRRANSAAYRRVTPARDVQDAASRLGLLEVQNVAVAMSMLGSFASAASRELRLHDLCVIAGSLGRGLAPSLAQRPGTAYLAGLLADIGALACAAVDPGYVALRQAHALDRPALEAAERGRYFASTRELGADLLANTGVPSDVVAAVAGDLHAEEEGLVRLTGFVVEAAPLLLAASEGEGAAEMPAELVALAGRFVLPVEEMVLLDGALSASADAAAALGNLRA